MPGRTRAWALGDARDVSLAPPPASCGPHSRTPSTSPFSAARDDLFVDAYDDDGVPTDDLALFGLAPMLAMRQQESGLLSPAEGVSSDSGEPNPMGH